ncbi:MAG: hypothetical protein HKN87_02220 [Saprospiraceae bacterium]|nr:hypothetical protein [Saprospiraceae bacterium]
MDVLQRYFRFVLWSFFLGTIPLVIRSQTTSIHFDKPYYFAGEYVFYSFCNAALRGDTIIAKVDLEGTGDLVEPYYLSVNNGCAEGYIKLDFTLPSGSYPLKIGVYAEDFEKSLVVHTVLHVFNDQEHTAEETIDIDSLTAADPSISYVSEAFEVGKQLEHTIDLPVNIDAEVQRISISVRDHKLFTGHTATVRLAKSAQLPSQRLQGIPFFGSRKVEEPGRIRNHLLFAFNAQDMVFDGTGVNLDTDEFNLALTPFSEKRQILFLDYLDREISITPRVPDPAPQVVLPKPRLDASIARHLLSYREEKKINRLFKQVAILTIPDSTNTGRTVPEPVHFIDVQNYDLRGTTVDLMKEILVSLKFRRNGKDRYRTQMMYQRYGITKLFSRSPLFLVNNLGTRDGNYIAHLPLQDIESFKIYSDYGVLEKLSTMAFGGLVYVDMLDPNFVLANEHALPVMRLQGVQAPIQYPIAIKEPVEAPAVSSLLFWHPNVDPENGQVRLDFQAADVATDYLVEIVVHYKNGNNAQIVRQLVRVQ